MCFFVTRKLNLFLIKNFYLKSTILFQMKKYKCIVSYDGTSYAGFQIQKHSITIQSALQEAFFRRFQNPIMVTGASRTDSGVHALGQVVHFEHEGIEDLNYFLHQINSLLPKDIRILSIQEVPFSFHSRYDSKKKTYYYYVTPIQHLPPFGREYFLTLPAKIDLNAMKEASKAFIGTHDFRAFAHHADIGCAKNKPIKTIYRFDWIQESEKIRIEIEGTGFLHKMVRNMMGTLIDVGMGKIAKENIPSILISKDRKKAGQTAPAHPLFLAKIDY
jgi:tRNA pseudouridine38-40 synthase